MKEINATIKSTIDMYNFMKELLKELPTKLVNCEEDVKDLPKQELIDIINKYDCTFEADDGDVFICYKRKLTDAEITRSKEAGERNLKCNLSRIKTWADGSEKYNLQIRTYLALKDIQIPTINC